MIGVIGHAAIDTIRRGSSIMKSPGGAPTYCSFYLRQVGIDVLPITLVGNDFSEYVIEYRDRGIETGGIKVLNNCRTTSYEITYYGKTRRLRLLARCRDFLTDDLYDLPNAVAVNPIAREIGLDVLRHIRRNAGFVGVDLQGFTRVFDEDNYVSTRADINEITEVMKYADFVKASIDDLSIDELNTVVNKYPDKVVVLTMGSDGSVLMHNGHRLRAVTDGIVNSRDPTGAGDVLTCALTHMLSRGEDLEWSFVFANAVAVAKTMGEGPYGIIDDAIVNEIVDKLLPRLIKT